MNNFLRAQLRHFSINSIYNTIRPGLGLVCGMVALLAMLSPGDAIAAIGFSGGAISPATQQVCSGSTGTFTFNPTTCSLGAGPDWSGTYSVDSSSDGITWFVASGASTGVITAASPTVVYTTPVLTTATPGCITVHYRVSVTGIVAHCLGLTDFFSGPVDVNICPLPAPIGGNTPICFGNVLTLTSATAGGTWSSGGPAITVINPTIGDVTPSSLAGGTATVSYTALGCSATVVVTANPTPNPITGAASVCQGSTTLLVSGPAGGTWTSSSADATVNALGVVTGVTAGGTATISYALAPGGCFQVKTISVNPVPTAITGGLAICVTGTTSLNSTPAGGNWISGAPGTATVNITSGLVTGVSVGIANITYALPVTGCRAVTTVTVNSTPAAITGSFNVCQGDTVTLSSASAGGAWSTSDALIASVPNVTVGDVVGEASGTATITYSLGSCFATAVVTVNATPTPIAGSHVVCLGQTTVLTSSPSGGTWSSSIPANGSVSSSGTVTGLTLGTTIITYGLPGACIDTHLISVEPLPLPITGTLAICVGSCTTLLSGTAGGTWAISNTAIDTIGLTSGSLCGVSGGSDIVTYTLPTGCQVTTVVTINPLPDSITGPAGVCAGFTITLVSGPSGGTWTSSIPPIGSIDPVSGVFTGVSLGGGTTQVNYTLPTGCVMTRDISVYPNPTAIGGTLTVCFGSTTVLNNFTPGGPGTWSSSHPLIAPINPTSGVVTGLGVGTATITYTMPTGCITTAIVTVNPLPAAIGGYPRTCLGFCTPLVNTTSGGSWTSFDPTIATVNPSTGLLCGISLGTTFITYTIPTGCYTITIATVDAVPPPPTGDSSICVGETSVISHIIPGGTWTSSDTVTARVFVGTGLVTGVTAGTAYITYTLPTGCTAVTLITVNPNPPATTGTLYMCEGNSTTLTNVFPGGAWSSSNTGIATVGTSGVVTGVGAGLATISYTLPSGCAATVQVTVYPLPAIIGSVLVCPGIAQTLIGAPSGGLWTSSVPSVATIGSLSGTVMGITTGTSVITYTLATTCRTTAVVTVQPLPSLIVGPSQVCVNSTIALFNFTPPGGIWSSSNTAIASIGTNGVVTGISAGVVLITFTATSTGCIVTKSITVNPLPAPISGPTVVCAGSTITLTTASTGGTWSSSGLHASVGSLSGVVTGISSGAEVITYTLPTGCIATYTISVNPLPGAILGGLLVCHGYTIVLTNDTAGGVWSIAPATVATISATGVVTAVAPGTATVTYTMPLTGCFVTAVVTVNPLPAPITGLLNLCVNDSTTLHDTTSGGTWSSENIYIAVIDDTTGLLATVSAGTVTITYTISSTGCYTTAVVTINPTPQPITGPLQVCVNDSVTLSNVTTGGSWSSSNPAVAVIGSATGVVRGILPGTSVITYTLPSSCPRVVVVTVNPLPATISGALSICLGDTTTLTSATPGGTWASSAPLTAFIFMPSGVMIGIATGTATITYKLPTGCFTASTVIVNPIPLASLISGSRQVCVNATTNLSYPAAGGTWSSAHPLIATVTPSGGVVTGIAPGTARITYTLPTGCDTFITVTVNPIPSAITGVASVCVNSTTTLSTITTGGTWSSSNLAIGSINSSGVFTGIAQGTSTVSYILPTGCFITRIVTVNPLPGPIVGVAVICNGSSTILSSTPTGGGWSTGNPFVASVSAFSTGFDSAVVTGLNVGTARITYTLPTGCISTIVVTVQPMPTTVLGPDSVCVGSTITLTSGPTAGVWISGNAAVGTIDALTGVYTGISVGVDTVTFTITYPPIGCSVTHVITVNPVPTAIYGDTSVCVGFSITAIDTTAGGTWSISDGTIASINPVTGVITGIAEGSATITYTLPTTCFVVRRIHVRPIPNIGVTNSNPSVICKYASVTLTASGAGPGGNYFWAPPTGLSGTSGPVVTASPTITTTYTVIGTTQYGCPDTAFVTVLVDSLLNGITITGQDSICKGDCTLLIANGREGTYFNWKPSVGLSCTICDTVTACPVTTTTYNAVAIDSLGCRDSLYFTVTVMPLPLIKVLPNPAIVCNGSSTQLFATDSFSSAGNITKFAWFPNAYISCDTCPSPFVSNTFNLVYRVTGITPFGCQDSIRVPVTVLDSAFNSINKDTVICIGGSAQLDITSFNPDGSRSDYLWSNPGNTLNNIYIHNPIATPQVTTTYSVIVTPNVCWPDTLYTTVVVVPYPSITITPAGPITVSPGTSVPLAATIDNEMIITSYAWTNPATLSCTECYNTVASPTGNTTYTFSATSIYGCTSTKTVTINLGCEESQVFIPNVFTPNGDGMNDRFYVSSKGISKITKMLIYNRWGELVYERYNIGGDNPAEGWDGQYKGVVLAPDVFYYFIEAECAIDGIKYKYKGDVAIVR